MKSSIFALVVAATLIGGVSSVRGANSLRVRNAHDTAARFAREVYNKTDAGRLSACAEAKQSRPATVGDIYGGLPMPYGYPLPSGSRVGTGFWWKACVREVHYDRPGMRSYIKEINKHDREEMTPEVCYEFCKSSKPANLFGIRRGNVCTCLPFEDYEEASGGDDDMCDSPCPGNPTVMCGGLGGMTDVYEMHDCDNLPDVPCMRPPQPVEWAEEYPSKFYLGWKTPCANAQLGALTVQGLKCQVNCKPGHILIENTIECKQHGDPLGYTWAQVTGHAACSSVECGKPPYAQHAKYPQGIVMYPTITTYTCQMGYTTNAKPDGPQQFGVECMKSGIFGPVENCQPINCGKCPALDNATSALAGTDVYYKDSCSYTCDNGFSIDGLSTGTKVFTTSCVGDGSFSLPRDCQPVSCGAPQQIANSICVPGAVVYPNDAEYTCATGYTLTGKVGGGVEIKRSCDKDGNFVPTTKQCLPINCGLAPTVANAKCGQSAEVYFPDKATYYCNFGYTDTGVLPGITTASAACGADGNIDVSNIACKPVECGVPPTITDASIADPLKAPASMNYASPGLTYECKDGFSTNPNDNPFAPVANEFPIYCQASGLFTVASPPCVDINDCNAFSCGVNGVCENVLPPTGKPTKDFKCQCDPGYEEVTEFSNGDFVQKTCLNIDDCPVPDSCAGTSGQAGDCQDGDQTYTCSCNPGYEATMMTSPASNQTCTPVVCGAVPVAPNAAVSGAPVAPAEANYETPDWKYTCDKGYTLSGKVNGNTTFTGECNAQGSFETLPVCKIITCGTPSGQPNTQLSFLGTEVLYMEEATYACEVGYSLNGKKDGLKSFTTTCQADGKFAAPQTCKNIECGSPAAQDHATVESGTFVYLESANITCATGYTLTGQAGGANSYQLDCLSTGSFMAVKECKPVSCGVPGAHTNAVPGSTAEKFYTEEAEYTIATGYGIDGAADSPRTYKVKCLAVGGFSNPPIVKPIECGAVPTRDHAQTGSTGMMTYVTKATYKCDTGYTVDGKPLAITFFQLSCGADGNFVGPTGCKPIECPAIPAAKLEFAAQVNDPSGTQLQSLAYSAMKEEITLQCNPGYSTDGASESINVKYAVQCDATGKLIFRGSCKRNDDCSGAGNNCAPNGVCKNKAVPTGDHYKDFDCECDSGFKLNVTADGKTKSCGNIPNCPQGACSPGRCQDLVNDYTCVCPKGYVSVAVGKDRSCKPASCGAVQTQDHATTTDARSVVKFNENPVSYDCKNGYSIDGDAQGVKKFDQGCKLVTIDTPSSTSVVKPDSLNGFQYIALANGVCYRFTVGGTIRESEGGYSDCSTVDEYKTGLGSYSTTSGTVQSYTNGDGTCYQGGGRRSTLEITTSTSAITTSLSVTQSPTCFYTLKLTVPQSVSYETPEKCEAVSCPVPTLTNATTPTSSLTFGEKAKYKCAAGYSVDSMPNGCPNSCRSGLDDFSVTCEANGSVTGVHDCKPVGCEAVGKTPLGPHAKWNDGKVPVVDYVVADGYTPGYKLAACQGDCDADTECAAGLTCFQRDRDENLPWCSGDPGAGNDYCYEATILNFPDSGVVTCAHGFALDKDDKDMKEYKATCNADGTISMSGGKPGITPKCTAIDCGAAPDVKFSTKSGSTLFGGKITYTALVGYSVNGSEIGSKSESITCKGDGTWSRVVTFQRIKCPAFADVQNADKTELVPAPAKYTFLEVAEEEVHDRKPPGLSVHRALGLTSARSTRFLRALNPLYMDKVKVTCAKGHYVQQTTRNMSQVGNGYTPVGPKEILLECDAQGDLTPESPADMTSIECRPVSCKPPAETISQKQVDVPAEGYISFDEEGKVDCNAGYSQDGLPAGSPFHFEKCLETGLLDTRKKCQDIDWCSIGGDPPTSTNGKCGANGKCADGLLDYTCNCDFGYEVKILDNVHQTCVNTDECITQQGKAKCAGADKYGTCVDGLGKYTCTCATGYKVETSDVLVAGKTEQREECGPKICPPLPAHPNAAPPQLYTKLSYKESAVYTCSTGHVIDGDLAKGDQFTVTCQEDATLSAFKDCKPVKCPALTAHAKSATSTTAIAYGEAATYTCDDGHSISGRGYAPRGTDGIGQAVAWQHVEGVFCSDEWNPYKNTEYNQEECKARCNEDSDCVGAAVTISNWNQINPDEVYCGLCKTSTTMVHQNFDVYWKAPPTTDTEFNVTCSAAGALVDPQPAGCSAVVCGTLSEVPNSEGKCSKAPAVFGVECEEKCLTGYTTDQAVSGPSNAGFKVGCASTGDFTGVKSCKPISCGSPPQVGKATGNVQKAHYFGGSYKVYCMNGYASPCMTAGSQITVSCGSDGKYTAGKTAPCSDNVPTDCEPVSCGTPQSTANATTTDGAKVYLEIATWTCKAGYSTDGTPTGPSTFKKDCQATKEFGKSSPSDCEDMDMCTGNPCGANGYCKDTGVAGDISPGYTCTCLAGYEVKMVNGKPTCSEDDCNGNPCGAGKGTCTDLSASGGAQGQYTCNCINGYELDESVPLKPKCVRASCGPYPVTPPLQNVEMDTIQTNQPLIKVVTWKGAAVTVDPLKNQKIGRSYDKGTYTCALGYSTDGKVTPESKTFTLTCLATGLFDRTLASTECQPVQCDNWQWPLLDHTTLLNQESMYEYGDVLRFQCAAGYSTDGKIGGPTTFGVKCQADGTFEDPHPACQPTECNVNDAAGATHSAAATVVYEASVQYTCVYGYETQAGGKTFFGKCGAGGKLTYEVGKDRCNPVSCGTPGAQPNAACSMCATEMLYTSNAVTVTCQSGFTVGGAGQATSYAISCGEDGQFDQSPAGTCSGVSYPVAGTAFDATNRNIGVGNCQIVFKTNAGVIVDTVTTDANGNYNVGLGAGDYTMTATKAGWISSTRTLTVTGPIARGAGADMFLTETLPLGKWRVILTWAAHTRDLDSWTFFGASKVGFSQKKRTDGNGLSATLDWDWTQGFGPETTTLRDVGFCKSQGKDCIYEFRVHNFVPSDGAMGASKGHIRVFAGDENGGKLAHESDMPTSIGSDLWYSAYTLSAGFPPKLYPGKAVAPPYVEISTAQDGKYGYRGTNFGPGQKWSAGGTDKQLMVGFAVTSYAPASISKWQKAAWTNVMGTANDLQPLECLDSPVAWPTGGGYVACDEGWFLQKLYRASSSDSDIAVMTQKRCCKPKENPAKWGACVDVEGFSTSKGYRSCSAWQNTTSSGAKIASGLVPMAIAGFRILPRSNGAGASTEGWKEVDKIKCCHFPEMDLIPLR